MPLKIKRRASPLTLFYKLMCDECDQIFGTLWTREYVAMWHPHPSLEKKYMCPLCGNNHTKCKLINQQEYEELERIWNMEDLQFSMPDDTEDKDIPVIDLSNFN